MTTARNPTAPLLPALNKSKLLPLLCSCDLKHGVWRIFHLNVFRRVMLVPVLSSIGTSKEKTSGVVTVRAVSKGGRCTAGEIDSYLDENEAWCLWGERRAALASKWIEVSQKWSLNESPTIKQPKFTEPMTAFLLSREVSWQWRKMTLGASYLKLYDTLLR